MKKFFLGIFALSIIGGVTYLFFGDRVKTQFLRPRNSNTPQGISVTPGSDESSRQPEIEIVAQDLNIPWEVAFLPDGGVLVTQRPGTLLRIAPDRQVIGQVEGVRHIGEGGLLGMAIHPNFEENNYIYLYMTTQSSGSLTNRVERYKLENNTLSDRAVIIEGIPGASNHDGGRIKFGPDGKLYVTTGDASQENLAQDRDSLAGKILRLNDDGTIPADNPFGNAVWTYGHRNSQGIAWDEQGRMWATEHGRSGVRSGFDEINLIEKGKNYGWPDIEGDEIAEGMQSPVLHSGANDTWAPGGLVYYNGSLYFAGLRGSALYEARVSELGDLELVEHFKNEYGRLRTVTLGSDNNLYITTSNTDGRGRPRDGDDKIIGINPEIFE